MQVRIVQLVGDTLRLRDENYHELASRQIDAEGLEGLLRDSERDYRISHDAVHLGKNPLASHGRDLCRWLDGDEQWISGLRTRDGLALHIDVESRLRNLPWELLYDQAYLCANPNRVFTPVHRVGLGEATSKPSPTPLAAPELHNRPLRVLFMAASARGVQPVLAYENEERLILEYTKKQPIELEVEESGSLDWLAEHIRDNAPGYFDVVHLSGHAHQTAQGPRFILEDDFGERAEADARAIAAAFEGRYPRLLFLSGCETAKAGEAGALPSLAEALVEAGFPSVLGWTLPVGDVHATVSAAVLYELLAVGERLDRAVAVARQRLLEAESLHWHLLRYYADDTPSTPLVTPKNTPGRARLKARPAHSQFMDAGSKVEVCPRELFVGRRRLLQQGLRTLKATEGEEAYAEGLLLSGMGGLGKSSMTARLAERLPRYTRVVLAGVVDEPAFKAALRQQITDRSAREVLDGEDELDRWLSDLLKALEQPALFIFDDFEKNRLGENVETFRPSAAAAHILQALGRAIRANGSPCRIVVTCRYRFSLPAPLRLAEIPLISMRGVALEKKIRLLREQHPQRREALEGRVIETAAGNPRLLDRLYLLLANQDVDLEALLDQMAAVEDEFREDVLLESLVAAQPGRGRELLATALLVGLPLLEAELAEILPDFRVEDLVRAAAAGLLERYAEPPGEWWYYASPLLAPYLRGTLTTSEEAARSGRAAKALFSSRWEGDGPMNDEIALALIRLALRGGDDDIAAKVTDRLSNLWVNRDAYRAAKELCESALAQVDNYRLWHNLARAEVVLGEAEQALAHYQQALQGCPVVQQDTPEEELRERAAILHNLAGLVAQRGEPDEAMALWEQSLEIEKQIGNVRGQAVTRHAMAGVLVQQGQVEQAMALWEQSLETYERIGDVREQAATLHNMAGVLAQQGQVARAMAMWKQSLETYERIGDVGGQAATLHNMAGVLVQQGQVARALALWEQSLEIEEQIGNVRGRAVTLHAMAGVLVQQGQVERAMALWEQSLEMKEQIGVVRGQAATLHAMAGVLVQQGQVERAMALWERSLEMTEQIGDVGGQAATLHAMAGVLAQQGQVERAMALWEQSLEMKEQIGNVGGQAATLHEMAGVLADQGQVERAMALWEQSLEMKEQIGDVREQAATLHNMAWAVGQSGHQEEKERLNREAATLLARIGAWPDLVTVLNNMGGQFIYQALWLALRVHVPVEKLLGLGNAAFERWTPESQAAPLLATGLNFLVLQRYQAHPDHEQFMQFTSSLLYACAETSGITPETFEEWMKTERLGDPSYFQPALDEALEREIPEEEWFFDRKRLKGE